MKKILSILLSLVILISLVSCTDSQSSSTDIESSIEELISEVSESLSSEETASSEGTSNEESSQLTSEETTSEAVSEEVASEDVSTEEDASSEDVSKEDGSTPALYKVKDSSGNIAWLFGSIHVGDNRFYPLPSYVMDAFNGADALAVEFDIMAFEEDVSAMTSALALMVYSDGTTIKDHISEETYNEAVKIVKNNGYYFAQLEYYMPCFWESLIADFFYQNNGIDASTGVDRALLKAAKEMKKPIYDIESAELQYGMMANFSEELQEVLLQSAIEAYNENADLEEFETMKNLWAKGDSDELKKFLNDETEFSSEEEKLLYEEYNYAMSTARNIKMTEYVEEALRSGKEVFICVGSAHVICDNAMIDLLTEKGYQIERIS